MTGFLESALVFLAGLLARLALMVLVMAVFAVPLLLALKTWGGATALWQRAHGLRRVAGLVWRSQLILLFLYPAALLLPITYDVRIVSAGVYGPITFSVVAASLLAYLLGVSFLSAFRAPPPPGRVRKLSSASQPLPARWKRRFRIYAALAALSALYPTVLLYSVSFSPTNRLYLKELYPGRVAPMMALLDLGVLAVWLAVFGLYFLGVLRQHRTGDRALQQELERIRAEARRGVPRPIFYVAVVCALAFMGLLVLLRYR